MAITRTAFTDDDGTGTTGTVINNAVKTELYDQIDAAFSVFIDPTSAASGDVLTADGAGAMAFAAPAATVTGDSDQIILGVEVFT